ncbi:MAG: GAF domain-containing protein [Aquabacterium sp.]
MENQVPQPSLEAAEPPWCVDRVIQTHLLRQRPSKAPDHQAENAAMMALVEALATDPESVAQRLVEIALGLTGAGSAGLSLVDREDGREVFRWIATAGEYTRYLRGTMPRDFSPCGEVLLRGEPLLMRDMVGAYPYVEVLQPPPTEVLLVPFAKDGTLIGTVWIVGHRPDHTFEEEDLRIVKSLALFASAVSTTVGLVQGLVAREAGYSRELKDTRLLHDVACRLIGAEGSHVLFGEILDAAIEITQADAGTIQLHCQDTGTLGFLATRGFEPGILAHFSCVDASSGSSCGIALATGQRVTITFRSDVPDPDESHRLHLEAGIQSAQSTPLISRTGQPLGMFSTHWRAHRELTERELRFLDLLGRQAADLIERTQVQEALRTSEKELREGARRKDEFLAVLAHELRNPLAPIRSGIDLLKQATRRAQSWRSCGR